NRCAASALKRCCPPPKTSYPGTSPSGSAGACSRAAAVTTCRRAVLYDSPVRAMRSRTNFLRCLCSVIACPCSGRRRRGGRPRRTTAAPPVSTVDSVGPPRWHGYHLRPRTAGGRGPPVRGYGTRAAPAGSLTGPEAGAEVARGAVRGRGAGPLRSRGHRHAAVGQEQRGVQQAHEFAALVPVEDPVRL